MAEFLSTVTQTVTAGNIVTFNEVIRNGCDAISHRAGSGIVTLHGKKRYIVAFSANISGATADTPVQLAIAINGEPLVNATMIATPSAADAVNNVSTVIAITVPCSCCYNVAVENNGAADVTVSNANLVVIREE